MANFLKYLETRSRFIEIKKLEFDLDERIKLIRELKKEIIVKLRVFIY